MQSCRRSGSSRIDNNANNYRGEPFHVLFSSISYRSTSGEIVKIGFSAGNLSPVHPDPITGRDEIRLE